ncbi:MAG: anthranilate phosphoribosyltransferase [Kiritimatiellia bacterium]
MIREAIARLVERQPLTRAEARDTLREIMRGEATPAQIAGFLTALRMAGETADIIAGAAEAMREAVTPVVTRRPHLVDTCGTGGDGAHTFNISTTAAFVAAGAGAAVAKHGNRGVSSKSGSADVLAALGVKTDCDPAVMTRCLDDIGVAFLFAPVLHPAMKHAIGPRREIGIRTLFNILGPLTNPAGARRGVLGVYNDTLLRLVADASHALGAERLFVVHGSDGLDEITTTGPSTVAEVTPAGVNVGILDPRDLGLSTASPADRGREPSENAAITRAILSGEKGPRRDIVLVNAATAIAAAGLAADLREGLAPRGGIGRFGAARVKLDELVRATTASAQS